MTDTEINEAPATEATAGTDLHGKINQAVTTAKDGAHKALETASDAAHKALETTRDGASKALETTRATAGDAARKAGEAIEANPLAVLAGGLALGALAGALLPRTEREAELIGPVGKRLADTAKSAAGAALETGKTELSAIGLNKDTLQAQGKSLLDGVLAALGEAGKAAGQAAKK